MGWQPKARGTMIADRYRVPVRPAPGRLVDAIDGEAPPEDAAVRIARAPAAGGDADAWAEAWRAARADSRAVAGLRELALDGEGAWAVLEPEPRAADGSGAAIQVGEVEALGAALAAAGLAVDEIEPAMLAAGPDGRLVLDGVVPLAREARTRREGAAALRRLVPIGADEPPWEAVPGPPAPARPRAHSGGRRRRLVLAGTLLALAAAAALLALPAVQARSGEPAAPGDAVAREAAAAGVTVTVTESAPAETETVATVETVIETVVETAVPPPAPPEAAGAAPSGQSEAPVLPVAEAVALPPPDAPILPAAAAGAPVLAVPTGG